MSHEDWTRLGELYTKSGQLSEEEASELSLLMRMKDGEVRKERKR